MRELHTIVCALVFSVSTACGPGPMVLEWLDQEPEALCNDGTSAGYYFRAGRESGVDHWVIFLQGGGFCANQAECALRGPELMSSADWPPQMPGQGIFSVDPGLNPDFAEANHVFLKYCSSDFWSGDRAASSETDGLHFRGARILESTIDDLVARGHFPPGGNAEVLLAGTSAGGLGVLSNLDRVAGMLAGRATVKGIDDAGWLPDVQPFDAQLDPMRERLADAVLYWNGQVDASCASDRPGEEGDCYFGGYVYPYLESPLFVHAAQRDFVILVHQGVWPPYTAIEADYVACEFAPAMRDSLGDVSAVFCLDIVGHGLLTAPAFWATEYQEYSLESMLGDWFFDRPGERHVVQPGPDCPTS